MSDLYRADFGDTPLTADEIQGLIPSLTTQSELNRSSLQTSCRGAGGL